MEKTKKSKKAQAFAKQVFFSVIGLPILIIGIILIPLPGPGILITLLGLYIISLGFESAKVHRDKYVQKVKDIYKKSKEKQDAFIDKHLD